MNTPGERDSGAGSPASGWAGGASGAAAAVVQSAPPPPKGGVTITRGQANAQWSRFIAGE
ncbi:MAG: hypothetical protein ACRDQG_00080 [Pseudonocardiaceae bacterium]